MRVAIAAATLLLSVHASAAEIARVGPFAFHSSLWINLHETLMYFATEKKAPDVSPLTPEERTIWADAVETYRKTGSGTISFRREMRITSDVLTQVSDEETRPELREPLGPSLVQAAPIYRRHFWPADDRANRFWIAYTAAMVRDAGDELAQAHARVYGVAWPKAIRVDAAPYAVPFGAYTMVGQLAGVHETVAAREAGNSGLAALEVVFHEGSHAIVDPNNGPVAEAIKKHADRLGIAPPRDLWHAILFATSSELTRRALINRGATEYKPSVYGMYDRVWPQYREPIEEYWLAHLDDRMTLDAAIGQIVEASTKPR